MTRLSPCTGRSSTFPAESSAEILGALRPNPLSLYASHHNLLTSPPASPHTHINMAPQYNASAPGTTDKVSFLLNWRRSSYLLEPTLQQADFCVSVDATPYHSPIFLAQSKGYFAEEGIKVAILEVSCRSPVR